MPPGRNGVPIVSVVTTASVPVSTTVTSPALPFFRLIQRWLVLGFTAMAPVAIPAGSVIVVIAPDERSTFLNLSVAVPSRK